MKTCYWHERLNTLLPVRSGENLARPNRSKQSADELHSRRSGARLFLAKHHRRRGAIKYLRGDSCKFSTSTPVSTLEPRETSRSSARLASAAIRTKSVPGARSRLSN